MPADDILQLLTILIILILVMAAAFVTTRYIARFQQVKSSGGNIEVIETYRLTATQYVQIIRLGGTYVAVAVCKDTVTKLAELTSDELVKLNTAQKEGSNFKDVLSFIKNKGNDASDIQS